MLYRFLPQYRIAFYEQLRTALRENNVELVLVYGNGSDKDRAKGDLVELPWAEFVPNKIIRVMGRELYWQPVTKHFKGADLLIVEQASKLLVNYYAFLRQIMRRPKIAFWGHGRNFQATSKNRLAEWIKRQFSRRVHWWFAYNDMSVEIVKGLGFPADRICNVQNAIDTTELRQIAEQMLPEKRSELCRELGIHGNNVGIFCGSMYPEKRVDFLLEAAHKIKERIPDFELLLVGSGETRDVAEAAATEHEWIHFLGPKFDEEKARLLAISKVYLMPGAVGLSVLDAFATGTPLFTTDVTTHGPEIDYLEHGINGMISRDNLESYVADIVHYLSDQSAYTRMRENAWSAANRYSMETMVENFKNGIVAALADV